MAYSLLMTFKGCHFDKLVILTRFFSFFKVFLQDIHFVFTLLQDIHFYLDKTYRTCYTSVQHPVSLFGGFR